MKKRLDPFMQSCLAAMRKGREAAKWIAATEADNPYVRYEHKRYWREEFARARKEMENSL